MAARDRWRSVDSPVGPLQAFFPPVIQSGVEPRMDAIPAVGEQTDAILTALGYSPQRIAELRAEGDIDALALLRVRRRWRHQRLWVVFARAS